MGVRTEWAPLTQKPLRRLDPRLGPPRLLRLLRPLGLAIPILNLKRRIRKLYQHFKVLLVPQTRLRSGHDARLGPARLVVARGVLVRGAVALTAGLDPHEGVEELGGRVGGGPDAEAGVLDVAPVAPAEAAGGLGAGAALVDDEVRGEGGGLEVGGEGGVELGLVPVGVAVGVVEGLGGVVLGRVSLCGGSGVEGCWKGAYRVVVGHVGDATADGLGRPSLGIDITVDLGRRLKVVLFHQISIKFFVSQVSLVRPTGPRKS